MESITQALPTDDGDSNREPLPKWKTLSLARDPVERADWVLRGAILLYVIGVAVAMFTRAGSAMGDIALMDVGLEHGQIFFWERATAAFLLLAACSLFLYPSTLALVAIAAVVALEGYAAHRGGGFPFAEYTPWAFALRYLTPLALIPLILTDWIAPSRRWRAASAAWILRIGVAIVFCIHGLEALWEHPGFIDLIIGSARNLFDFAIPEATAINLLRIIGVVDIVIAVLILVGTWRPLLGWIAFWGLVTALSRPLAHGFGAYPEVLVRSSHVLAAIAIWWITSAMRGDGEKAGSGEGSTRDRNAT